jgi:hypothetical protein
MFQIIAIILQNTRAFHLLITVYKNYAFFVTNIYNFAIPCYLEMNERRKVIRIREKRNEIVDVERVIIDEPVMVIPCGL